MKLQDLHETVKEGEAKWGRQLNSILFSYRVRKQASTGFSPFRLLYGRDPVLPFELDHDLGPLVDPTPIEDRSDEYVRSKMDNIHEALLCKADDNILKSQARQAKHYNAKHARNEFLPDEKVFRRNPLVATKMKAMKRGAKWLGPYTVVRRNEAGNYILMNKQGKINKKAYPPCHLKRYIQRSQHIPGAESDYGSAVESDEETIPASQPDDAIPGCTTASQPHSPVRTAASPVRTDDAVPGCTTASQPHSPVRTDDGIPVRTKASPPPPVRTAIPYRQDKTMEVAEILAALADGGEALDPISPLSSPPASPTQTLVYLAEESGPSDPPSPTSTVVTIGNGAEVPFQDQTMEVFDVEVLLAGGDVPAKPITFHPLTQYVRKSVAMQFGIAVGRAARVKQDKLDFKGVGKICGVNFTEHEVEGDGNCLFRTFSYLILGNDCKHDIIRLNICQYISEPENEAKLRTYWDQDKYTSGVDYIKKTGMNKDRCWGTHVELFACAQLAGKDVNVFTLDRWTKYPASGNCKRTTKHGLFISNASGSHFNPVIGVD